MAVREFSSVEELKAHYAALHRRCFEPRPGVVKPAAPKRDVRPAEPDRYAVPYVPELPNEGFRVPTLRQTRGLARHSAIEMMVLTATVTGVSRAELMGPRRRAHLTKARQIGMWLAIRFTGQSLLEVGRRYGKDHTTVLHAVRRLDAVMAALEMAADREPVDIAHALWAAEWPSPKTLGAIR